MAGAAEAGTQTAGHLLFQTGKAGYAGSGAELCHTAHHDHRAAGQHNVVVGDIQQVCHKAVMPLAAGIGSQMDAVAPRHKALHAVGGIAEADIEVGAHTGAAKLLAEQQQRRRADAAADNGDALVGRRQRGGVKAVAAGAGHSQCVPCRQRGQLPGALALDLIQKG